MNVILTRSARAPKSAGPPWAMPILGILGYPALCQLVKFWLAGDAFALLSVQVQGLEP